MTDRESLVAAWSAKDRTRAVLPADRALIDASATIRALIIDLVLSGGPEDELYDAAATLGRLVAQRGGSPTLASVTLDHAADVLDARSAPWLVPARAAVAEGFAATLVEAAELQAMRTWEFPRCAVPLGEAGLAICAGHPSDDDELLAAWAARVAKAAALAGVRRAVLSGGERACAALVDALGVAGIEVNIAPKPR
ncbi:MAG TPA: hypothetical protein VGL81_08355 [Polyangiaceae bacterium]|jgi:hypothetical protein